jgi:hypothetical protein
MLIGLGNSALLILIIIILSISTILRVVLCLTNILSSLFLNPIYFYNTLPLTLGLLNIRFNLGTTIRLSLSIIDLVFALINTYNKVSKVVVSIETIFNLAL